VYEALRWLSYGLMWSLTSACVGRASGAENFRPPPQKYFFDNIGHEQTYAPQQTAPWFDHQTSGEP
jgi:hypothetical protein